MPQSRIHLLLLAILACALAAQAKFASFESSSSSAQQCQQCIARLTTGASSLPRAVATHACARIGAVGVECAEEAASELYAVETTLRVQSLSLSRQYNSHADGASQQVSLEMFPRYMCVHLQALAAFI
jgi:hypothetical protein